MKLFTINISVEGLLDHGQRHLGDGPHALDSGIIDDDVDTAELLNNCRERVAHAVVGRDVELLEEEPRILLQIGDGGERTRRRHHKAAPGGEFESQRVAYTSGGAAGNEHHFLLANCH